MILDAESGKSCESEAVMLLHSDFQASQSYTVTFSLKTKQIKTTAKLKMKVCACLYPVLGRNGKS